MTKTWAAGRRELLLFLLSAGVAAFAVAALFQLHPWPTAMRPQAQGLSWPLTAFYVALGGAAVLVSPWTGIVETPDFKDRRRWLRIALWSLGIGLLIGASDLSISAFTSWGAHIEANDRTNGYTWANVALPWSLAHYAHASIISESLFRLAAILIPAWLVGHLLLRDRFQIAVFWTFATLAAFIEPIEKAINVRHWPLDGMAPMDQFMTLDGAVMQLAYAYLLRRFGWAAPILARYGYYLLVRVSAGYFFPHTSTMYPGPH